MKLKLTFILLIFFLVSCTHQKPFDKEKEIKEVLKLHQLQRDYHFKKDAISFVNQFSKNFTSINKGIISQPKKEEIITQFQNYFSTVEFLKWDDVTEPIIRFSDDGTLAYTLVNKIVKVSFENKDGEKTTQETHFAWTAIYKKYNGEWKLDCMTSTNK